MTSHRVARRRLLLLTGLMVLWGCGASAPSPKTDGGSPPDGGLPLTGPYDLPGVSYAVGAGEPIAAPEEVWTFVPVADARCANGTSTGMAVNLTRRSDRVLIFLAGGGACWEAAACAAGTATHITDTMGEAAVLGEAGHANLAVLFDRTAVDNPFADSSFVYLPYCTGDLHAGTQVTTYDWFGPKPLEHVGANNMDAYLRRLRPTFPKASRVVLSGVSAGGYGATFHWWRVQKAFPWAPVDVLNDSGLPVDVAPDGRYGTMQQRWAIAFPPGCTECASRLSAVFTRSAELLTSPRRYGLMGYLQDGTIGLYFGLSGQAIETALSAHRDGAASNVRTFYLSGGQHVVLSTPQAATAAGTTARSWVQTFADLAQSLEHVGP
jgi:hypothetical protein